MVSLGVTASCRGSWGQGARPQLHNGGRSAAGEWSSLRAQPAAGARTGEGEGAAGCQDCVSGCVKEAGPRCSTGGCHVAEPPAGEGAGAAGSQQLRPRCVEEGTVYSGNGAVHMTIL